MVLDRSSKKHKETQGYTKEDLLDLSMFKFSIYINEQMYIICNISK